MTVTPVGSIHASEDRRGQNASSGERPRVLHVVERMGGGLADAMISYAQSATDFEHHLLYARSNDASFAVDELTHYATTTEFRNGHVARVRQVAEVARRVGADIVHGHSAYGGLYARLGVRRSRVGVAYTPHSFPFERLATAAPLRAFFYLVERALGRNTTVFIACSRREESLSKQISPRSHSAFVANVARVPESVQDRSTKEDAGSERLLVVGAGRIMPQKGPSFFAEIARRLGSDANAPTADFVWIGDGSDELLKKELTDAGVAITGWLDRSEVLELMSDATLYVHTALWEGFPIVLLESVAVGTPIAVINRPYADGLPSEAVLSEEVAHLQLRDLLISRTKRDAALEATRRVFEDHTAEKQGSQLSVAYRSAL